MIFALITLIGLSIYNYINVRLKLKDSQKETIAFADWLAQNYMYSHHRNGEAYYQHITDIGENTPGGLYTTQQLLKIYRHQNLK